MPRQHIDDLLSEPPTRADALAKVRALLHGDEARACMPMGLRHQLDTAIVLYGHVVGMEALDGMRDAIRETHGMRVVGSLASVTGGE